jgi:hypothetical protein
MSEGAAPTATGHRALPFIALIVGACAIGFVPNLVRLADTGPAAAGSRGRWRPGGGGIEHCQ